MPYGLEPLKIERFGGLNTLVDPTNLPNYASPDCQDVEFTPGLVRTRPGLTSLFAALGGNPTVNYLKTYITPAAALRALALDSLGNLYKENPIGTLAVISNTIMAGYANSVSLFGREYLAIGDGQFGIDIPRQFDDTNLDRVSQVGPGASVLAVTDENVSYAITASPNGATQPASIAIAASPNGAIETGFTVTMLTNASHGLVVGQLVTIAGVGIAGYNGTFSVNSVPDSTHFTYTAGASGLTASGGGTSSSAIATFQTSTIYSFIVGQLVTVAGVTVGGYNGTWTIRSIVDVTHFTAQLSVGGLAASGSGTVTAAGSIIGGVHQVSVIFVTRNGYLTAPSVSLTWTAGGGKRAVINDIPIGPPNVIQRILCFTAAGGDSFFYSTGDPSIFSSNMVIPDNTTTFATVDFSDAILLEGVNVDALFELVELGECSGVTEYFSRLFWWGERNKIQNLINLSFDGGYYVSPSVGPLGWTIDPTFGAGGLLVNSSFFGMAWRIQGNSASPNGRISQAAYKDTNGNFIFQQNIGYSVRFRIDAANFIGSKTVNIRLNSISSGGDIAIASAGFTIPVQGEYVIPFSAPLPAVIPTDLRLIVDAVVQGVPFASVTIKDIELFQTNQPINTTTVRASKVEDPESYDGVTGFLQPSPSDGQPVRCCFVLRNNFYMVKDRRLYVTQDDGVNEPNQWSVQKVSQKVGTLSVRGVGLGDEWAIIAGQDGVYYFDGGEPQKISQEIQPTWDSINWTLGYLIDVKVDTKRKRVYVSVPLGASATANNRLLTLDYTDGFGDPNPTNTVNIAGIGRKWSPWAIACNSMNLISRADGTEQLWFGNGALNGKIYQLDSTGTVFADDGAAINSYWQSGYFQDTGRLLFGQLTANIVGSGACNLILRKGDQGWITNLRSWTLSSFGFHDMERTLNIETERLAVRFGTNAAGANFSLQGIALYAKAATFAELRGVNF